MRYSTDINSDNVPVFVTYVHWAIAVSLSLCSNNTWVLALF